MYIFMIKVTIKMLTGSYHFIHNEVPEHYNNEYFISQFCHTCLEKTASIIIKTVQTEDINNIISKVLCE